MSQIALLTDRAVLRVSGEDRVSFLQGLVSNDVREAAPGRAVWAALLTAQGKWLADFFMFSDGEALLLDVEVGQRDMLAAMYKRFRLRAKVALDPVELPVFAGWGGPAPASATAAPDPRLAEAGWRMLGEGSANATEAAYDLHRLALGLPAGSRDLEAERSTLVESGFDELHGIGWEKGCYMGQELTARTKYRGLVKRRLAPVLVEGSLPAPGTPVTRDGGEVGTIRSGRDGRALASLRLDVLRETGRVTGLRCGEAVLTPVIPGWMRLEKTQLASA